MTPSPHPLFHRPAFETVRWDAKTRLIWHPADVKAHYRTPDQAFCYFRKEISLSDTPVEAMARVFADSRYRLWINGREIGRGPGRSDPRWALVDELDLRGYLVAGRNSIVILAAYFGYRTGQTISRFPAVIFEADWMLDGVRARAGSDESWKCLHAPEFILGAPRINGCQPRIEVIDAARRDERMLTLDYDDSAWPRVQTRDAMSSPFWNWAPRDIPLLQTGWFPIGKSCGQGTFILGAADSHPVPEQIVEEQKSVVWIEEEQSLPLHFPPGDNVTGTTAILDAGTIEAGYLQADVETGQPCVIDFLFGEFLHDKRVPLHLNSYRLLERHVLPPGRHRIESMFNWRAARYVQLFVRSQGAVTLHACGLQTRYYPLVDRAAARTGDARLDSLWASSFKSLHLCLQDGMLDSSSREQQQWMGDARLQAIYHVHISGDSRMHRRVLEQFAQSQDCTGMTTSRYPDDHHNLPPIPSYCLHWVSSFGEYHRFTGDDAFVRKWWPNLLLAVRWFTAYQNASGLMEDVPYWSYIDWNGVKPMDVQNGGMITALNLLYLEALQTIVNLSPVAGAPEVGDHFAREIERLGKALRDTAWSPELGAYVDCVQGGDRRPAFSEPTNALALLHLHPLADDERAIAILKTIFPADGTSDAVLCSPFLFYFMTKALARHGCQTRALRYFRERFAPMLRASHGTVWENWSLVTERPGQEPEFSSASHAWSSTWLAHALESVVGVEPLEPYFRRIRINPQLGDLDRITCGIPAGEEVYRIEITRVAGTLQARFQIPKNHEIIFGDRSFGPGLHDQVPLG